MDSLSFRLDGRTAVVTGGSKGIGRSIALGLADAGANVIVVARNSDEVDTVVKEIKELGAKVAGVPADITKKEGIRKVYDTTMDVFGSCEILVNNAGMNIRKTNIHEQTEEEIERIFSLNIHALFNTTACFGKHMCEKKRGSIINISSIAGVSAVRTGAAYAMSKAAVNELTKYLALEWGEFNVRVNAIAPWYFLTPLTEPVLTNESYRNKVLSRTMLPRLGDMRDIAALTVFLASDASGFITAQTINCDGGMREYGFDPTK